MKDAEVVKLANALASGASPLFGVVGSSPTLGTSCRVKKLKRAVLSRKSPNKARIDFRESRPSAMKALDSFRTAPFGDHGILEAVSAPASRTASGLEQKAALKN